MSAGSPGTYNGVNDLTFCWIPKSGVQPIRLLAFLCGPAWVEPRVSLLETLFVIRNQDNTE